MKGTPPTQTAHAATHRTVCYVHLYEEHLHLIGRLARPPLPAPRTRFRPFQRHQRPPPPATLPRRPPQTLSRRAPRDNARDAPPHGAGARSRFPPPPPCVSHPPYAPPMRGTDQGADEGAREGARSALPRTRQPLPTGQWRPHAAGRDGARGARAMRGEKKKKRLRGRQKTSPAPRAALCSRGAQGTCEGHSGPLFPPVSKLAPPPLAVQCRIRLESRAAGVCPLRRQAPRGGAPLPLAQRRHPPQTPSIALARANKTGCEIGGGDGRGLPLPPLRAAPPHPPIQTPPSRPALGTCARVAAADSPLATRPQPTPPHPPQPRFCPTGRRVRAVRVPPVALWLARSGRAVWWALCPRLSLPPARGRVRFSPPPPVLVCLRARAGGRSSLRGAVGAVAAFYLFLASSYCGPLRLAPGRAPWRPPPCAT